MLTPRLVVSLVALLLIAPMVGAQTSPDLKVTVTGYLLGYYRIPDIQPEDYLTDCRPPIGGKPSENREDIWKSASPSAADLHGENKLPFSAAANGLIAGMGSNLGVELYSRTYGSGNSLHPKERDPGSRGPGGAIFETSVQWDKMDQPWKIGDNVACFLSLAHYDAIVPGKEDFYFGPERLRRIAQRLAALDLLPGSDFHPVRMLAANLIEKTSRAQAPQEIPDGLKRLSFSPGAPEDIEVIGLTDSATVLPFLHTVTVGNKSLTGAAISLTIKLCKVADWDDRESCTNQQNTPTIVNVTSSAPVTYSLAGLTAGNNYRLCFEQPASSSAKIQKPQTSCLRFAVARPYLLSGSCAVSGGGTSDACRDFEPPYLWKEKENVIVLGVVDQGLPALIGRDNRSWRNVEVGDLRTEVAALDPALALTEALHEFQSREHRDPRNSRKILLAQMSRAKAEELVAHLDTKIQFDLVIAAPAMAPAYASSTGDVTINPDDGGSFRPFLIVPQAGQSKPPKPGLDSTIDPIHQITITGSTATRKLTLVAGRTRLEGHPVSSFQPDLDNLARAVVRLPLGGNSYFITAALKVLRERTGADAALMQKRDFYWGPFLPHLDPGGMPNPPSDVEKIDRVLWAGDVLRVLTVRGSILRKTLKESKDFDQAEDQTTQSIEEVGRALVRFGIQPTEDGDYLINGTLLDDERLYTIATTNHIASGDTGYPELNDPELAGRELKNPGADQPIGQQISKLVCEGLKQSPCIAAPSGSSALFATAHAPLPQASSSFLPSFTRWLQTALNRPLPPDRIAPRTSEQETQDRRTWKLALHSASISFKRAKSNLSEADREKLLGSITEPGVSTRNSHTWELASQAEFVSSGRWMDYYVRHQLEYSNQVNQEKIGFPTSSYDKNRTVLDVGLFFHFVTGSKGLGSLALGGQKSEPKFGLVFEPVRLDRPIRKEQLLITHPDKSQQILPLDFTWRYAMRAGLRFENSKSHLEVGAQPTWTHGALLQISTKAGNCPVDAANSMQDCLNGFAPPLDPIDQLRTGKFQHSFYLDWDWSAKVWHGWQLTLQDQGEWFPFSSGNDNSADTRYRNDSTIKLSVPIFSNLSFQPGVERFTYKNKVGDTKLGRWSPTASFTYSFEHFSGGRWMTSLLHKPGGNDDSSGGE